MRLFSSHPRASSSSLLQKQASEYTPIVFQCIYTNKTALIPSITLTDYSHTHTPSYTHSSYMARIYLCVLRERWIEFTQPHRPRSPYQTPCTFDLHFSYLYSLRRNEKRRHKRRESPAESFRTQVPRAFTLERTHPCSHTYSIKFTMSGSARKSI